MGAPPEQILPKAELEAQGDQLGAEFGLGKCTLARVTMRPTAVAIVAAGTAHRGEAIVGVVIALAVGGLLQWRGSRHWERLFRYDAGLAEVSAEKAEPVVVRWADLASLKLRFASTEDEGWHVTTCELRDEAGNVVTARHGHGAEELAAIIAEADRVHTERLLPGLIAAYESGEAVSLTGAAVDKPDTAVDQWGVAGIPWADVTWIDVRGPGQSITIRYAAKSKKRLSQLGTLNAPVLCCLLQHAASAHDNVRIGRFDRFQLGGFTGGSDAAA